MKVISKIGLSVAISVVSVSACKSKNEAITLKSFDDQAYFESLRSDVYKSKASKQADIKALSDLLPDTLALTYEDISYSETSGATTLSNVNLTAVDSEVGVNIETLSLWDVNEAAISDRLSGKNLDSVVSLLGRLEARNLSAVGLEAVFKPMMDASNDLSQKLLEDASGGLDMSDAIPAQSIDKYEISLESFIATDIKIHPWVLTLTHAPFANDGDEDAPEANEAWHMFQKIAAWSYAVSYGDIAAYDGVINLAMTQADMPVSLDMNIGLMGYKGYSRGDMDYGVIRDMKYVMDTPVPVGADSNIKSMKMTTSTDFSSYENVNLSQIMKHLAIGKMPDRDNTDLMSLGIWQGQGSQVSVDGQNLYSLDSYKLDMSEFHGLVPEVLDVKIDNAKYNVAGFMSWIETMGDDLPQTADQKAEMEKTFADISEVLSRHDMTEPSFDMQFAMHWDAETGVTDMGYGFGIDDIGRFKTRFDGVMPSYDAAINLLPEDMDDWDNFDDSELEKLFEETVAFKRFSNEMSDEGFDRLLALIIDFAQMTPDNPQSAMLKNSSPSQLRQMMAGAVAMTAPMVVKQLPSAEQHVITLTEFVTEGGTLKIDLEAQKPLTAQDMETLSPQIMAEPAKFEDFFTLDVVREARE